MSFSIGDYEEPIISMLWRYLSGEGFSGGSDSKESACNAGDPGSVPVLGRSPGEGNSNPLHFLAWEIPLAEEPGRLQSIRTQESDTT